MKTRIARLCIGVLLFGSIFLLPEHVTAADSSLKPFVSIREEVNDNIYERATGKRTEYITRLMPGATFLYKSPLWSWDAAYNFEFRNYARNSKNDEYTHNAALKGSIALIDNFLFLDLSDTYHRVTLDVSRDAANESSLFLNQTDQNIAVISPYLLWRLRGDNKLKTGYRFTDIRYWDSAGIEKQAHSGFADLTHEITSKLSLSAGYAYTRLESQPTSFNKHDVYGGFRYEYADKAFLYGQVGNSWQQFSNSVDVSYLFWNAGITHDFRFAVASVDAKVVTTEDPLAVSTKETSYSGKLEKTLQRGMVGLSTSYSEYVNTETKIMDRRRLGLTATGRYEVLQNTTSNLVISGERFSRKTASDYPYRITATAGLNYAMKNELTLGLTYSYVIDLFDLGNSDGSKQINKIALELRKSL